MSQATQRVRMPALLAEARDISPRALWSIRLLMAPIVIVGLLSQTSVAGVAGALVAQAALYWLLLRVASSPQEGDG